MGLISGCEPYWKVLSWLCHLSELQFFLICLMEIIIIALQDCNEDFIFFLEITGLGFCRHLFHSTYSS